MSFGPRGGGRGAARGDGRDRGRSGMRGTAGSDNDGSARSTSKLVRFDAHAAKRGNRGLQVKRGGDQFRQNSPRGWGRGRGNAQSPTNGPTNTPSHPYQKSNDSPQFGRAAAASATASATAGIPQDDYQLRQQVLKTAQDEERKAAMRDGRMHDPDHPRSLAEAITPVGECLDMCPERERVGRIIEKDVMGPEFDPSTCHLAYRNRIPDEARMVKKFRRAAAGVEEQVPSDLRPPAVLQTTLNFLLHDVVDNATSMADVQSFVWDRTRAIRNDFSIQQVSKKFDVRIAMDCFERIGRYHILSLHQMAGLHESVESTYDYQQDKQQLDTTLFSLMQYYDDHKNTYRSDNEAEFRAYGIIMAIANYDPYLENRLSSWPTQVRNDPRVKVALKLYHAAGDVLEAKGPLRPHKHHAIAHKNWQRFWHLIASSETSYLTACCAETIFNNVRRGALHGIWSSVRQGSQTVQDWTAEDLAEALGFDEEDEVVEFCGKYGFHFQENPDDGTYFINLTLQNWQGAAHGLKPQYFSRVIVEKKRQGRSYRAILQGMSVVDAQNRGYLRKDKEVEDEGQEGEGQEESLFVSEDEKDETGSSKAKAVKSFKPEVNGAFSQQATPAQTSRIPSTTPFQPSADDVPTNTTTPLFKFGASTTPKATFPSAPNAIPALAATKANPFAQATREAPPPKDNPFSTTNVQVPAQGGNATEPTAKPNPFAAPLTASSKFVFNPSLTKSQPTNNPFAFLSKPPTAAASPETASVTQAPLNPFKASAPTHPALQQTPATSQATSANPFAWLSQPSSQAPAASESPKATASSQPVTSNPAPRTNEFAFLGQSAADPLATTPQPDLTSLFRPSSIIPRASPISTLPNGVAAPNLPQPPTAAPTPQFNLGGGVSSNSTTTQATLGTPTAQLAPPPVSVLRQVSPPRVTHQQRVSEALDSISHDMFFEPERGILAQMIEFTVSWVTMDALIGVNAERTREKADHFRYCTLATRYGRIWREVARSLRLQRRGRERRQKRQAERAARHKERREKERLRKMSELEKFKQKEMERLHGLGDASMALDSGVEETRQARLASYGEETFRTPAMPTHSRSSTQPTNSLANATPQNESSHISKPSSAPKPSSAADAAAVIPFSDSLYGDALPPRNTRLSTTRSNYFRRKAMGLLSDSSESDEEMVPTLFKTSGKKHRASLGLHDMIMTPSAYIKNSSSQMTPEQIEAEDEALFVRLRKVRSNMEEELMLIKTSGKKRGREDDETLAPGPSSGYKRRERRASLGSHNIIMTQSASIKNSPSQKTPEEIRAEDEALFARMRKVCEQMDEGAAWFREVLANDAALQKSQSRSASAEQRASFGTSTPTAHQQYRPLAGNYDNLGASVGSANAGASRQSSGSHHYMALAPRSVPKFYSRDSLFVRREDYGKSRAQRDEERRAKQAEEDKKKQAEEDANRQKEIDEIAKQVEQAQRQRQSSGMAFVAQPKTNELAVPFSQSMSSCGGLGATKGVFGQTASGQTSGTHGNVWGQASAYASGQAVPSHFGQEISKAADNPFRLPTSNDTSFSQAAFDSSGFARNGVAVESWPVQPQSQPQEALFTPLIEFGNESEAPPTNGLAPLSMPNASYTSGDGELTASWQSQTYESFKAVDTVEEIETGDMNTESQAVIVIGKHDDQIDESNEGFDDGVMEQFVVEDEHGDVFKEWDMEEDEQGVDDGVGEQYMEVVELGDGEEGDEDGEEDSEEDSEMDSGEDDVEEEWNEEDEDTEEDVKQGLQSVKELRALGSTAEEPIELDSD